MRTLCAMLCVAAAASLAVAKDPARQCLSTAMAGGSDPNSISFRASITVPVPGLSVEPWDFMGKYRRGKEYLFDIPDFRNERWFKTLLYAYGAYAAYESLSDEDEFKLKYPLRSEPSLGVNYQTEDGKVVWLMPRGKPMVAISLDERRQFDEIVVFQIKDGAFFIGYARTVGW